jgi:arginyl-tRNA--protein-N-Asp/Glu arginylyltransferase
MFYHEVVSPRALPGDVFDYLLARGWYPMRQMIFTTSHLDAAENLEPQRVHWLRYHVPEVKLRKSHRRIIRKNRDYDLRLVSPFAHSPELNDLYRLYLDSVDFEGYPSVAAATFEPDTDNIYDTRAFILRDRDRVFGCGIFHRGETSVASILHFYDPDYSALSPGKYLILLTMDYCRRENIEWYYPGYVIEGNPRMNYKLFLGESAAQYYHPEPHPMNGSWKEFNRSILITGESSRQTFRSDIPG